MAPLHSAQDWPEEPSTAGLQESHSLLSISMAGRNRLLSLNLQTALVFLMNYVPWEAFVIPDDVRRIWFSHWSHVIARDFVCTPRVCCLMNPRNSLQHRVLHNTPECYKASSSPRCVESISVDKRRANSLTLTQVWVFKKMPSMKMWNLTVHIDTGRDNVLNKKKESCVLMQGHLAIHQAHGRLPELCGRVRRWLSSKVTSESWS